MSIYTAPAAVKFLWEHKFFESKRTVSEVESALSKEGFNFPGPNLRMALDRADMLKKDTADKLVRFVQIRPFLGVREEGVLPQELIVALGDRFENELHDLSLNFGRSGTCSAFLLRKMLEKLLFLAFAKNGQLDRLRDDKKGFVGLSAMLDLAQEQKNRKGHTLLMPKTAKSIQGLKFLGDTAAHNPVSSVQMETIIPVMPLIVTAYSELVQSI